jgi:sec-independent protein translocase protein TatA
MAGDRKAPIRGGDQSRATRERRIAKRLAGGRPVDYLAQPTNLEEGKDLGGLSLTHWLVVLLVVVILFGAGKLPRLMGDLATGIKTFKRTLNEDDAADKPPAVTASTERRQPAETR